MLKNSLWRPLSRFWRLATAAFAGAMLAIRREIYVNNHQVKDRLFAPLERSWVASFALDLAPYLNELSLFELCCLAQLGERALSRLTAAGLNQFGVPLEAAGTTKTTAKGS